MSADIHNVAKLEGHLADAEKKPDVGKHVAAVVEEIKRVETEEVPTFIDFVSSAFLNFLPPSFLLL